MTIHPFNPISRAIGLALLANVAAELDRLTKAFRKGSGYLLVMNTEFGSPKHMVDYDGVILRKDHDMACEYVLKA